MNPYEDVAEEMKRQSEGPKRFGKTALRLGSTVGAASFAPVLARAAPFLSSYLTEDMAIKGLSKVSPKFGSFIKSAMNAGKSFDEVRDFIGEKVQESQKSTDMSDHPVEKLAPALHQFLKQEIGKGRKPIQALAVAKVNGHGKDIEKISKKIGKNLSEMIDQLYGGEQQSQAALQPSASAQQPQSPVQAQPLQQPQTQQGPGPGQQALMAILQQINKTRGG